MQAELEALEAALGGAQRPTAALIGGAKVSSKLDVLGHVLDRVDVLIIGGGMANTFLNAQGTERRQVAVRARSRSRPRARSWPRPTAKNVTIVLPDRRRGRQRSSRPAPQTRTVPVDAVAIPTT